MFNKTLDVQIVTYRPELAMLESLLESLQQQAVSGWTIGTRILDNSADNEISANVRKLLEHHIERYSLPAIDFVVSASNIGYGKGHNLLTKRGAAEFILILNPDVILEPDALATLLERVAHDGDDGVAGWEMRQIPYEHPKDYDPATGQVSWVSGAAVLFRRKALDSVGGFEPRISLYGEDVDLSWRLRAKGWLLVYVARAAVQHPTYDYPDQIKAQQVVGGTFSNLLIRARFGEWQDISRGIKMILKELVVPQAFPGRRRALIGNLVKFALQLPYFRLTKVRSNANFAPDFRRWDYEVRRDGAFHVFNSKRWKAANDAPEQLPLVSVLIRTRGRPVLLQQALSSVLAQTYRPLEVVVIEDGPPSCFTILDEFKRHFNVRYAATGEQVGRAGAGNLALELARGHYVNFLDDTDLMFADHVEVMVGAARSAHCRAAYGLGWEIHIDSIDPSPGAGHNRNPLTRHRQSFNRAILWQQNYLPLQAVLFERSLYEQYGGFDPRLERLEVWDLWTRYSLSHDFAFVSKTTTKHRVLVNVPNDGSDQSEFDREYGIVKAKQAQMHIQTTPFDVAVMIDQYIRDRSLRGCENNPGLGQRIRA